MHPTQEPSIKVTDLQFSYRPDAYDNSSAISVLENINFELTPGSKCLLLGSNGAGKSTLLRILGGKHMIPQKCVRILGRPAFHDTTLSTSVAYLGGSWVRDVAFCGYDVAHQADIPVRDMVKSIENVDPERYAKLIDSLEIDEGWRLHKVSDGQRRRVQIMLGLLKPFDILLLDEITTDLDVVCRQNLLTYLTEEAKERSVTIIYATHILDGLDDWATHLAFIANKTLKVFAPMEEIADIQERKKSGSMNPLLRTIEQWMRDERAEKKQKMMTA